MSSDFHILRKRFAKKGPRLVFLTSLFAARSTSRMIYYIKFLFSAIIFSKGNIFCFRHGDFFLLIPKRQSSRFWYFKTVLVIACELLYEKM